MSGKGCHFLLEDYLVCAGLDTSITVRWWEATT